MIIKCSTVSDMYVLPILMTQEVIWIALLRDTQVKTLVLPEDRTKKPKQY